MSTTTRPCVLVVDDDPDIRMMVSLQLDMNGYDVVEAADGASGLEMVRTHHPDGVVLDLRMPVMSGIDALPLMRAEIPSSAVIVFTAEPNQEVRQTVSALGADACIGKLQPPALLGAELDRLLTATGA